MNHPQVKSLCGNRFPASLGVRASIRDAALTGPICAETRRTAQNSSHLSPQHCPNPHHRCWSNCWIILKIVRASIRNTALTGPKCAGTLRTALRALSIEAPTVSVSPSQVLELLLGHPQVESLCGDRLSASGLPSGNFLLHSEIVACHSRVVIFRKSQVARQVEKALISPNNPK